ncbi:MAG TPA: GMC oxidoreductase, partial [Alphaproteobacteria bacterium]|nr:GMC oxidoreductase [Alphaproteobacteria bacterium]
PVAHDLPGVGRNLQDHLDVAVQFACTRPITLDRELALHRSALIALQYALTGRGKGTEQGVEAGAFVRTRPDLAAPDVQFTFVAALVNDHARQRPDGYGFMGHSCQLRPESVGTIALKSADPLAHPAIQPNYLATEGDRRTMRDGVRMVREVMLGGPLAPYRGAELRPGPDVRSDAEIDAFVRRHGETIYHPVGTCAMGAGPEAVVDDELRLHGLAGLRVADASIMPRLVGGNTNAPTITIAEKAADMIRGRQALPPAVLPAGGPTTETLQGVA